MCINIMKMHNTQIFHTVVKIQNFQLIKIFDMVTNVNPDLIKQTTHIRMGGNASTV